MNILFICRGNVARSQMAEVLFKKYIKGDYDVSSAGIKLSGEECALIDIPYIGNVIDVIKEEGIDVSQNRRKQLTKEIFDNADKVFLVVDDNDPLPEYFTGDKIIKWSVIDPKGADLAKVKEIFNKIKQFVLSTSF